MMRGSLNRVRLKPSGDDTDQARTKKARGGLASAELTQKNKEPEQQGDTNSRNMVTPDLDIAKNEFARASSRREKLKPIRSHLKTTPSQVKPPYKVAESNMDMDSMALKDMLRFLDEEEVLLTQLQSKMSEELSRLQVEEHVFLHTLKIFGEKHDGPSNKSNENQQQSSSEDQDLIDALNSALKDNGESKPDDVDKGKATCT